MYGTKIIYGLSSETDQLSFESAYWTVSLTILDKSYTKMHRVQLKSKIFK